MSSDNIQGLENNPMPLSLIPASQFTISQLADLLTRGFEGYLIPIHIDEATLLTMLRRDGVDLTESRVLMKDGEPIGIALIARRGWTSRLAAMGIVSRARSGGVGTWAIQNLIEQARARGEKTMVLEVIEQNTAALKLYEKVGFKITRRLLGYKLENPQVESDDELTEIDIRELARLVAYHGLRDLPWQLTGATIMQHTPPSRAFRLNDAYCLISNPEAEHVAIWSVLVKARSRGAGLSPVLIRALFARFPNKTWHVPALYPEEICAVFDQIGMKREDISQWQMSLTL
ncbi:MAG: GNAT family N-acetyltransferase [Anaerolineales bacterium]|nr:GNAT family N-acetyltransferase [Anaerolineales bacterium]